MEESKTDGKWSTLTAATSPFSPKTELPLEPTQGDASAARTIKSIVTPTEKTQKSWKKSLKKEKKEKEIKKPCGEDANKAEGKGTKGGDETQEQDSKMKKTPTETRKAEPTSKDKLPESSIYKEAPSKDVRPKMVAEQQSPAGKKKKLTAKKKTGNSTAHGLMAERAKSEARKTTEAKKRVIVCSPGKTSKTASTVIPGPPAKSPLSTQVKSKMLLATRSKEEPSPKISPFPAKKEPRFQRSSDERDRTTEEKREVRKDYFKMVRIKFRLEDNWNQLDVVLSHCLVVRSVGKASPLFSYLVVGDQVIQLDEKLPLEPDDVENYLDNCRGRTVTMFVIRPWNISHCGDRKIAKRDKECTYFVVEIPQVAERDSQFDFKYAHGKCTVTVVSSKSRAGHAFLENDRILDINGRPVSSFKEMELRNEIIRAIDSPKMCSFLVERPLSLRSSTNTSLSAARASEQVNEWLMDDACEIGAREAARFKFQKKISVNLKPLLMVQPKKDEKTVDATITAVEDDDEKKGKKRRRRSGRRMFSDNGKEISMAPTNVQDVNHLKKVTAKSGVIGFVRSYLQKY